MPGGRSFRTVKDREKFDKSVDRNFSPIFTKQLPLTNYPHFPLGIQRP